MERGLQGRYETTSAVGEKIQVFVPAPLPPHPPIDWTPELRNKFDSALLAVGRLDSVSDLLPDTSLFHGTSITPYPGRQHQPPEAPPGSVPCKLTPVTAIAPPISGCWLLQARIGRNSIFRCRIARIFP